MNDELIYRKLLIDSIEFMLSVTALCWSSTYFLDVGYDYVIKGVPLLQAVKTNFYYVYFLWVAGLLLWMKIEEKGIAITTALIILISGFFGSSLENFVSKDMNEVILRLTVVATSIIVLLAFLGYRSMERGRELSCYMILGVSTIFFSCLNDAGIIASFIPIFTFDYVKNFMIGMYVPCSAGLVYCGVILVKNDILYIDIK